MKLSFVVVGQFLERTDLIMYTFQRPRGDRVGVPIQHAVAMAFERIGHDDQHSDFRRASSTTPVRQKPVRQKPGGQLFGGLLPDLAEVFFQVVSRCQRLVQIQSFLKSKVFVL